MRAEKFSVMKSKTQIKIILPFLMILVPSIYAQTITQNNVDNEFIHHFDQRLLHHFTHQELIDLENDSEEKLNAVEYYYLNSYSLEIMEDCIACPGIDVNNFDITLYEHYRKKDETAVYRDNKNGFILYLVPLNDLEYQPQTLIAQQ